MMRLEEARVREVFCRFTVSLKVGPIPCTWYNKTVSMKVGPIPCTWYNKTA